MRGIFPAFSHFLAIRCLRAALVPVTLAGLLAGLGTATASAATCVTWSGTPAASPGTPDTALLATTVLSPCDAWAVGWQSSGGVHQTLIEHWDGASWTVTSSPSPGSSDNVLNGVHATSPANAWAAVNDPAPSATFNQLSAVGASSASNIWAVGDYAAGPTSELAFAIHCC